eukprot:TRINITY_DN10357_c0_g1_i1.p1 TRINITY_DN10357_c0_g1~~TRINITY_DN10357_c0_g1_i1.p1  ORF type:complete len:128 (+),score=5.12 TRINITY_DN10357_c0_g1_i1:127-510(+)
MADVKSAREPVNLVHQEAIHAETVKKETRNQRMFTEYTVNPHRKAALLAGKPNVASTGTTTTPSKAMLSTIKQGTRVPKAKYSFPQTTSQEYGWDIESDVSCMRQNASDSSARRLTLLPTGAGPEAR